MQSYASTFGDSLPFSGWTDKSSWRPSSDPTVTRNWDGRLDVFVRSTDNAIWHRAQATPNGAWSGWSSLGGHVNSNIAAIAFYQKCGLRMDHIRQDYFRYYREPMYQNGIQVCDMVVFRYDLEPAPPRKRLW